ncbi:Pyridoxamine 5'-phosphate oxidase [Consotaella salsifontis]|uniref:Pyridoxamine 5'-phosphate oxidase n=1 Tax=Consotaella salsifontis TaxID=1365950 RepID=A0A1T4PT94_9HYPH|nr:Pyridoxamine 5'-phosphate oxidase [Consotaella salsifontis]
MVFIHPDLAEFIASPVMIVIGTRDRANRPDIGRGIGAWTTADATGLQIIVSAWQYGGTIDNLRSNGAAALTFVRPSDYVCYQIKGRASIGEIGPAGLALSARYIAAMSEALARLGVAPEMSGVWLASREPTLFQVTPEAVFLQTPGPGAGTALAGSP